MGPKRAVVGGGNSKSGDGTGKAVHAMMSSILKKYSNFFQRHHAPDAHITNFHTAAMSRFPIFPLNLFVISGSFLLIFSN